MVLWTLAVQELGLLPTCIILDPIAHGVRGPSLQWHVMSLRVAPRLILLQMDVLTALSIKWNWGVLHSDASTVSKRSLSAGKPDKGGWGEAGAGGACTARSHQPIDQAGQIESPPAIKSGLSN